MSTDIARLAPVASGLTLLIAAFLKAAQSSSGSTGFAGRVEGALATELETLIGVLLVIGVMPRVSRILAMCIFLLFLNISLYKALSGEAACGCFGQVDVNPWFTTSLDAALLAGLALTHPVGAAAARPAKRTVIRTAVWPAVAGVSVGFVMWSRSPAVLEPSLPADEGARVILIEPDQWVEKKCPLLRHVDIGKYLSEGRWVGLLYHHDCPDCRHAIDRLRNRAASGGLEGRRIALIEVPPHADETDSSDLQLDEFVHARLSEARQWVVTTPIEMWLDDGLVTRVGIP